MSLCNCMCAEYRGYHSLNAICVFNKGGLKTEKLGQEQ